MGTESDLMAFFMVNVKMLKKNGYTTIDKDQLIPLAALNANEVYIASIKEAGISGEDDLHGLLRQLERFGFIQRNTESSFTFRTPAYRFFDVCIDILNREEKIGFSLSPLYLAIVAFCFSMTVGVIWEFFECTMDQLFLLDMQKDSVVNTIGSVMLDPTGGNNPGVIRNITDVIVVQSDGTQTALGLGGYLDIGLLDTMEDLFVNFIGALTFSIIGYFYVRSRGKGKFAKRFIPVANNSTPMAEESAPETGKDPGGQK